VEPFSLVGPFNGTWALDDDVKMHFGVHQLIEFSFPFLFLSIY